MITREEAKSLDLKCEPPEKCVYCGKTGDELLAEYETGWIRFGDFYQCPSCHALMGNIYAYENAVKVRALMEKKKEGKIITPSGSRIVTPPKSNVIILPGKN